MLYRTGDWGYMLSSGELEICGRCDTMVKIRGYSIELQVRGGSDHFSILCYGFVIKIFQRVYPFL